MTTRVWYAALATGQDPNNIKDMDAVWAKVRESRDLAKKFWSSGAELMDLLSKGEIVVTDAWSGRVAALQDQGHPIGYLDPAGSYAWMEDMLILKGSPMAECEELINFMLDPATAIAVAEGQNYPPSLDPNKVKLTDKIDEAAGLRSDRHDEGADLRRSGLLGGERGCLDQAVGQDLEGCLIAKRAVRDAPAGCGRGARPGAGDPRPGRDEATSRRSSSATSTSPMASSSPCGISRSGDRQGQLRHPARAFGLRQDHDPARPSPASSIPRRPDRIDGATRRRVPIYRAQHRHGVPELRAVPAHERLRQVAFGLKMRDVAAGRSRSRVGDALDMVRARRPATELPRSSPAASSSASRSPAPWSSSPRCCCSTSRCPRSTPSCARRCAVEIKRIQRELGITTIFVTHDQDEALAMADRIAVMNAGRDRAGRHAGRDLRPARHALRRRLHRQGQHAAPAP